MKNRKRFFCMLTLVLYCLAMLAGCGSSGRKWSDSDVIDDYGTVVRDGKETDVCVCHDQENVYIYTDDDKHKLVDSAALPMDELYDEDWDLDLAAFGDINGDNNSDLQVYLTHADMSESFIVWKWEKDTGYVYQPDISWFYRSTAVYDYEYDFSDFTGVWLADEDNLYDDCYIEFDQYGNWYLNVAGETIDEGYLVYASEWDCIYAECIWNSAIADSEVSLVGDLLYIDTLGFFDHLVSEDDTYDDDDSWDSDSDYYSWDSDLYQRNISEFEGVWYYDGDLSAETYIIIDGDGNWSYYERTPGDPEATEMDHGVLCYSADEVSTYYANSSVYGDMAYRMFELDEGIIIWDDDYVYYRME